MKFINYAHHLKMFRGRKRKLPFCLVPEPCFRDTDSDDDPIPEEEGRYEAHEDREHYQGDGLVQHDGSEHDTYEDSIPEDVPVDDVRNPEGQVPNDQAAGEDIEMNDEEQQHQQQQGSDEDDGASDDGGEDLEFLYIPDEEEQEEEEDDDDHVGDEVQLNYSALLDSLSKDWMAAKLEHTISKAASNAL